MPKLSPHVLPAYRRHKQSGQAVVTLNGKDFLLGRFGTPASREAYNRATGQWLAAGRQVPQAEQSITVVEVMAAFWQHAQTYYRKADASHTSEAENFRQAMIPLRETYGRTAAVDFGPLALKVVRDHMITAKGWCRPRLFAVSLLPPLRLRRRLPLGPRFGDGFLGDGDEVPQRVPHPVHAGGRFGDRCHF
jgi:hypothetical protein